MRLLLCIYTCEQDRHFLESLWNTPLLQQIESDPRFRILEVYADQKKKVSRIEGDRLTVSCPESYTFLSIKTHLMVQSALDLEFDFLLKLDATIARYDEKAHTKKAQMLARLTPRAVQSCIADPAFFNRDYNGLVSQSANQQGFESWAKTKGIDIDYINIFPRNERTPDYFLGKFYSLSRAFCQFIAKNGHDMATQHRLHLGGSEDVLIGRLFSLWKPAAKI